MKNARTYGWRTGETGAESGGFTLIELLTVISIIGLVAGLVIGVGPAAAAKMRKSRMQSDLRQMETAIESYKAKFGVYPPDNQTVIPQNVPVAAQSHLGFPNQLFYELTGCVYQKSANTFQSIHNSGILTSAQLQTIMSTDGIQNSSEDRREVQNYFKEIKPSQVGTFTTNGITINALIVPFAGPKTPTSPTGLPNYWNYVSKNPTNNTQTFDLWAVIVVGGVTNVISNWKE